MSTRQMLQRNAYALSVVFRRPLLGMVLLTLPFAITPIVMAQDSAVVSQYRQVVAAFRPNYLIPIMHSAGEHVGAVYEPRGRRFLYQAKECFPKLQPGNATASTLPSVKGELSGDLALGLGVKQVGTVELSGNLARVIEVEFTDVVVQTVSEGALRKTYLAKDCPELRDIISGTVITKASLKQPLLIVGALYSGRRQLVLRAQEGASAGAVLTALKKLPGFGKLGAEAKLRGQHEIVISASSASIMPIAVRAAFIPEYIGGFLSPGASTDTHAYVPFEPEKFPSQRQAFDQMLNDVMYGLEKDVTTTPARATLQ